MNQTAQNFKNKYDHSVDVEQSRQKTYSTYQKTRVRTDWSYDGASTSISQSLYKKPRAIVSSHMNKTSTNRFAKQKYFQIKNTQLIQERKPTIFKPYDLEKVPSKVFKLRKPSQIEDKSIEVVMLKNSFNFHDRIKQHSYLPLECFEDTSYDSITDKQIGEMLKQEKQIRAQIMEINALQTWQWVNGYIIGYPFKYLSDNKIKRCSRIHFILHFENAQRYIKKLERAFELRAQMDGLLRYNYYIANMTTDDLLELSQEQLDRIFGLCRIKEHVQLQEEIQKEYYKGQNQLVFKHFIDDNPIQNIIIPQEQVKPTPYYGKLPVLSNNPVKVVEDDGTIQYFQPKSFDHIVKHFNELSLYQYKEVINILAKLQQQSNKLFYVDLFYFLQRNVLKIDDFKNTQEMIIHRAMQQIRSEWADFIIETIKTQLRINTYRPALKDEMLDRFFQMIRMKMQDILLAFMQKNLRRLINFFKAIMPVQTKVNCTNDVQNIYVSTQQQIDYKIQNYKFYDPQEELFPQSNKPIFEISILLTHLEDDFQYSYPLKIFQQNIMYMVEKAIAELGNIPDPEVKILENYFKFSNKGYLKTPRRPLDNPDLLDKTEQENKWIWDIWVELNDIVEQIVYPLQEYLAKFKRYKDILQPQYELYDEENISYAEKVLEIVNALKERIIIIQNEIPDKIQVNIIQINLSDLLSKLIKKINENIYKLTDTLAKKNKEITTRAIEEFEEIHKKIRQTPNSIESLVEIKNFIKNDLPQELEKKQTTISVSISNYKVLEELQFQIRGDEIAKHWQLIGMPLQTQTLVEKTLESLEFLKNQLQKDQELEQQEFLKEISKVEQDIMQFTRITKDAYKISLTVASKLQHLEEQAKLFNHRESLLSKPQTDYNRVLILFKEFQPYNNMWTVVETWQNNSWLTSNWQKLNANECESFMNEGYRLINQSLKLIKDKCLSSVIKIGQDIKEQMEEFRPKVPLMLALKKDGMKQRHWSEISNRIGKNIDFDENDFTFQKALDLNLMESLQICQEVSDKANKEYSIELMLLEMKSKWADQKLTFLPFKKTYCMKGLDELSNMVDENILQSQAMQFSPYKKPFEDEIVEWYEILKSISEMIEQWTKLQTGYMYLQPIFDSPDIIKQLPVESKKFRMVDKIYKEIISFSMANLIVEKISMQEGLIQKIIDANSKLEQVQKELNNYLEKKRERFARFYFLSNDDLLEILSQSKEPIAVQPHLKKVFENIHRVEFDNKLLIRTMLSAEEEQITFVEPVNPCDKNVEDWIALIETQMQRSVKAELLKSVQNYQSCPRVEWVFKHPGQCVLNGSQIVWTKEVEANFADLSKYIQQLSIQLNDLVNLLKSDLTKQATITLNALIVIDVHAKDVVQQLINERIIHPHEFEWIMQLRYYLQNNDCRVKCIQTDFPYGYEYLGNTSRLVITPLTDKCYMTLMGALKLNLGGAPAGPAGTGKTETTKDLAKALAKQCVVFNCSDSMDYIMVGKFFKGLAGAGAWCCFDEFNRINIEVLSVIAQQLLVLFGEKAKDSTQCQFEGSTIRMNNTFSVFITMNPGYAGRTELPDNLKALFRSVAMMVPDYALIGEIMLYSFGFNEGRILAKKMVTTFTLCSEQLSSQDHYDYGMRAVRSVINAAGLLRRKYQNVKEEQLLLKALRDVNVPKFLSDDLPLFENIIKDLFPSIEENEQCYDKLENLNLQGLIGSPQFLEKVNQLYATTLVRHGIMLVGPAGGGKTTILKTLSQAINAKLKIINPKSVLIGELYGSFNLQTQEWFDGVLALIVRNVLKKNNEKYFIILDGPVDSLWIESMNTVLDDNKKLCLNSGQILTLTENVTMVFEVEDLVAASPATVSRCGMVYVEQNLIQYQTILKKNYLEDAIYYFEPLLNQIHVQISKLQVIHTFLKIHKIYSLIENADQDLLLIYSIALTVLPLFHLPQERTQINNLIIEMMKLKSKYLDLDDQLISEMTFDGKEFQKINVEDFQEEINNQLGYHEILIRTKESISTMRFTKDLLRNNVNVLIGGCSGVGKTVNALRMLQQDIGDDYQYINITFSAQTSSQMTQDMIDSKLEKRRKGYYGPGLGKKCVIFIDDINMPKKEIFGAQPALELIRQYMDHRGWYNRKDLFFMNIEDIIFLSACSRIQLPNRLLRHYNVIYMMDNDRKTIQFIFNRLISQFIKINNDNNWIVDKTIDIYELAKQQLLPTPLKPHYQFNLRDIWRVLQGICISKYEQYQELWSYEIKRIFCDRLINKQDKQILKEKLGGNNKVYFYFDEDNQYNKIQLNDVKQILDQQQINYNNDYQYSGTLKLVFFDYAIKHLLRIIRILKKPYNNALLLGLGGSGRQSLSKLAAFISQHVLSLLEFVKNYNFRNWREDLKKILLQAGLQNQPTTFLINDTQIIDDIMLEDLSSLINSGDVTNLYNDQDIDEIITTCKIDCITQNIQPNKINIYSSYLKRVKKNIHLIFCISPNNAPIILRMYPSLVNCSTIDYFTPWPAQALISVAYKYLQQYTDEFEFQPIEEQLVHIFQHIHSSVQTLTHQFLIEANRHTFITSSSYLALLNLYIDLLKQKKTELLVQLNRIKNGLDKLLKANNAVEELKANLQLMRPELEQAQIETEKMMQKLSIDKQKADEKQKQVALDEQDAAQQQNQATQLAEQAAQSVEEANVILDKTLEEVQKLKKDHLVEIKSLGQPPKPVKIILGGVVILNVDSIRKNGGDIIIKTVEYTKKEEDYFETAKKYLLNDPKDLLEMLKNYDKDNINSQHIHKLEQKIMQDPDFTLERAKQCSFAVKFLYSWVKAMYDYNKVYLETKPLRDKLQLTKEILYEKTEFLNQKKQELQEINNQIEILEKMYQDKLQMKEDLTQKIKDCEIKLIRAQKLTVGLSDEQKRWAKDILNFQEKQKTLIGDTVIAAAMVMYAGPYTQTYRQKLEQDWLNNLAIPHQKPLSMKLFLGSAVLIQKWNLYGLPKDDTSTENGIIITKSKRWPLMIDPQNQANLFIKNLGKDHTDGMDCIKQTDQNYMKIIELAVQLGKWVLIENASVQLDRSMDSLFNQDIKQHNQSYTIQIGDKQVYYSNEFKLLLTTTNPNPQFTPEDFVKVCVINFAITPEGLEEQMLAQIVGIENPQLENKKLDIVLKNAEDKGKLLQIEDSILLALSATNDIAEVLKDETLINELQNSKRFALEINKRVEDSKQTEEQIDEARNMYKPLAYRASLLFFCILDLASIDCMYQYSLQWFTQLFITSMQNTPAANVFQARLSNLSNYFTFQLFEHVCRSLFEKHKLLFSFLLTMKIYHNEINDQEMRFFLNGPQGDISVPQNPTTWIDENNWTRIYKQLHCISELKAFSNIKSDFLKSPYKFRMIYDAKDSESIDFEQNLDEFQKIILVNVFRPDFVVPSIQRWISLKMGQAYVIYSPVVIRDSFDDSNKFTPLIFVLSTGSDPINDFLDFVEEKQARYNSISLGQGQGQKAEKLIKDAIKDGSWVLLQNCHLAITWMPELEKLVSDLNEETNESFRLWLTSAPSSDFPITVLQNGLKLTLEPPEGLRNNLKRTYLQFEENELDDKSENYRKLLMSLSFFHAIIQDRRKFGAIGWNIPYEFTNEDLWVCVKQLGMLLEQQEDIPFKVISYLCGEINYGGRVTDKNDQRLIKCILQVYINQNALQEGYKYSESGIYKTIKAGRREDYINYIESLPLQPQPEVFGLNDNANIIYMENETRQMLSNLQKLQPKTSQGDHSANDEIVLNTITFLESKLPALFDIEAVYTEFPTKYEESMNTVLIQELYRYNRLIVVIQESIANLKKAIKGFISLNEELESVYNQLFENQVPSLWNQRGFLSLKPLGSWTQELQLRIQFLTKWIQKGTPSVFWISGFFFPQAFITGVLQNYARKYRISVDKLVFKLLFLDSISHDNISCSPEDGCYIHGIFIEGAVWNKLKHCIDRPKPKQLFSDLPMIQLLPQKNYNMIKEGIYQCPLYKVVSRAGTLSTTGHSTNFIMFLDLPSMIDEDYWIRGGVASFLSLRY